VSGVAGRRSHPHAAPRDALLYRFGTTLEDPPSWAKVLSFTQPAHSAPRTCKPDRGARTKVSSEKPERCDASNRRMQATEQTVAGQRAATQMEVVIAPVIETGLAFTKARSPRPTLPGLATRKSRRRVEYIVVDSWPHGALRSGGNRGVSPVFSPELLVGQRGCGSPPAVAAPLPRERRGAIGSSNPGCPEVR